MREFFYFPCEVKTVFLGNIVVHDVTGISANSAKLHNPSQPEPIPGLDLWIEVYSMLCILLAGTIQQKESQSGHQNVFFLPKHIQPPEVLAQIPVKFPIYFIVSQSSLLCPVFQTHWKPGKCNMCLYFHSIFILH